MANTKIPAELSSTPGIIDNSNATAITIDSSENVGIKEGSPSATLHTNSGTGNIGIHQESTDTGSYISFSDNSTTSISHVLLGAIANDLVFNAGDAERMRIDSSGNVGITAAASLRFNGIGDNTHAVGYDSTVDGSFIRGQSGIRVLTGTGSGTERMRIESGNVGIGTSADIATSSSSSSTGFWFSSSDYLAVARNQQRAAIFNRIGNDGEIVAFRKDGSTVGSIGADSGTTYIQGNSNSSGFLFGNSNVYPWDAGALSDANIELGSSDYRWNNLYLSGGVYVGGTGSANKLDDYEEGSWTPTLTAGTFSSVSATYTKVGNMVTINLDAVVGTGGATKITNLPFTAASTVGCGIYASGQAVSSRTQFNWVIAGVSAFFRGTGDSVAFTTQSLSSGATIHASITYRTS